MDPTTTPAPAVRRPGPPRVHRVGLVVATLAAAATFAGAAAVSGGIAPASASPSFAPAIATLPDASPVPRILVNTIYVPGAQPTPQPLPPVKVVVIHKPPRGDDEGGGD